IYTVRNEDAPTRMLVLEHPIRADWKLDAETRPAEQSATAYRFRIEVPSKQTKTFTVQEARPIVLQYSITNLNPEQIQAFTTERELTPEIEDALRRILAQISDLKARQKQAHQELDRAVESVAFDVNL